MNNTIIYYTSGRARVLWFVTVIAVACSAITIYLVSLLKTENAMEEFGSMTSFRIWQIALLLLGNIFTIVMMWMSDRYVLSIALINDNIIQLKTWSFFTITRTHEIDLHRFRDNNHRRYEGRLLIPGKPWVHASWERIKVKGKRPLIIDMQGSFPQGYDAYETLTLPAEPLH